MGKGGAPKVPPVKQYEEPVKIEDDKNAEVQRQRRRSMLATGRESTIGYGIQSMLKERLGQ